MIEISQSKESHCRTNTSVSEERNKFKRAGLWESQFRIRVGKLAIWVRSFEITQFTRSISSIRTGKPVLVMCIKASKDKHISRWVDWENLIYVRWNRIKDLCTKRRMILRLNLRFLNLVLQTWITLMSNRFHHTSLNFSWFLGYFPCFSWCFLLFPILGLTYSCLTSNIENGLFQKKSKQGAKGLWHGIFRGKDEENVKIVGVNKKR